MYEVRDECQLQETMEDFIAKTDSGVTIDDTEMAAFILKQVDSSYMGKGRFSQLLADRIDSNFSVPEYITNAFAFILMIGESA